MAEKQLIEFALEDGTTFLVEVDKQPTQPGAPKPVSRGNGVSVTAASKKFDQALEEIKPGETHLINKDYLISIMTQKFALTSTY
jgi:hypothetical protein